MMTPIPEISIIVPVYNVEKYLRECLDSIANQEFSEWECILVDDGSSDSSGAICDEYASRDSRFRVFHGPNRGVSVARNIGLDACRGRYIGFVDADDLIHRGMFQRLYQLIVKHDADVAQVSYESLYTTMSKPMRLVNSVEIYDREKVAAGLVIDEKIPSYMWIKLFRREIVNVRFPEGMVFEDIRFMTMCSGNIRRMVIAPDILYSYRRRKGSISKSNVVKNRMEYVRAVLYRARQLRELEPESVTDEMLNRSVWKAMISAVKYIARYGDRTQESFNRIKDISDLGRTVAAPKLKYLGVKLWFRSKLLLRRPLILVRLVRVHRKSHSLVLEMFD